ncbi:MAG: fumarylacetoacetate hydrolase family protein [Actinomycetota bacterium]|nr:fumarylacetoacetate hydrolase family protein [Actinomycetota bacterium]
MRIVRYQRGAEAATYGAIVDGAVHAIEGSIFSADPAVGARVAALDDVALLAPCEPTKMVAVGLNYRTHIAEMEKPVPTQPLIFYKTPNTIVGPGADVHRPEVAERFDYEGELAVVIGRRARRVTAENVGDFILGYTCANDVTVRDWQEDGQWTRAKSSDEFGPIGPAIVTDVADPGNLRVQTRLNGELRQDTSTADLLFDITSLLVFITEWITLEPGDVVLTGTSGGVGAMEVGDVVEVEIEGIGVLRNQIV